MTQTDMEKRFAQINAREPEQLTAKEAAHMREEYDFSQARKNPYAAKLKRQTDDIKQDGVG